MIRQWINRWLSGQQQTAPINNDTGHPTHAIRETTPYLFDATPTTVTPQPLAQPTLTASPHTESRTAANAMHISSADPDCGISYSPTLIDTLMDDHDDLLELYSQIAHIMAERRFDEIPEALTLFKTKLDVHLLTENLRFYCYLEQSLDEDAEERETMKTFRREMSTIARAVVTFIRKWQAHMITDDNKAEFLSEYAQIGDALAQRIEREEKGLYTLYMAA